MGRGLGLGWCQIAPGGSVAHDGKRLEAVAIVYGLLLGENLLIGGGPGGGVQKIRPDRRESDDGKRSSAVDVALGLILGETRWNWEGVQGEGGKQIARKQGIRIFSCAWK